MLTGAVAACVLWAMSSEDGVMKWAHEPTPDAAATVVNAHSDRRKKGFNAVAPYKTGDGEQLNAAHT